MRKYPITLRVYSERITKEKVIKAVEDLLSYYQNLHATRFNRGKCPLCNFFECEDCLWSIFHHMGCEEFANKQFNGDVGELKKVETWRVLRVKELRYWLKELKRPGVKILNG